MGSIHFTNYNIRSNLKDRNLLKAFLLRLFKKEKIPVGQIEFIFCTDDWLLQLNKKFLDHDFYTDTMTFVLSGKNEPVSGEAYLSIDRIKENASKLKIPYQEELVRVIIHSTLHFCGYKDKPKSKAADMLMRQESYLKLWNVPRET